MSMNELTSQIAKMARELNQLRGENTRLLSEVEFLRGLCRCIIEPGKGNVRITAVESVLHSYPIPVDTIDKVLADLESSSEYTGALERPPGSIFAATGSVATVDCSGIPHDSEKGKADSSHVERPHY